MKHRDIPFYTLSFAALALLSADAAPDGNTVAYSPDVVGVDRIFLIALRVPAETPELAIALPDCVLLFDRTPLPTKTTLRKYYFRALKPAAASEIRFVHPHGEVTVPLTIWSFEDLRQFRKLKGVQLPRRWPLGEPLPELKQAQTTTTEKIRQAASGTEADGYWLEFSDDQIWSLQPDSTIPRWHWVNITAGCPVHGKEIYRGRAFYPWRDVDNRPIRSYRDASLPYTWKIRCPVGGELYPSNDFANGDMTSGEFADDGIGGGWVKAGQHYGFIAEICQAYCHKMLNVAPPCADAYLRTGDVRYMHKALVAFSRLAVEWAYLATMTHHRHRNSVAQVERLGQSRFSEGPFLRRSGFTVYCIDLPRYQMAHADAYDKIFPAIADDKTILPFLRTKGYHLNSHEELRRFIEENLFAVWMQGAMDGATQSNEPFAQMGLARLAEVLNYARGNEFMDWLYDHPAGKMRYFVTNTFFRDGAPYESTGGYNGMHVSAIGPIVESIAHLRQLRPQRYPVERYPDLAASRRYHSVFDFAMNTVNIDRTYPRIGDVGEHPQYRRRGRIPWQNGGAKAFEHAYRIFKDPKFAWALTNQPDWQPSVGYPYTRAEIEAAAAAWPDEWNDRSCLQDGYGVAMLRSGKGVHKRALWIMYGRARGHTHDDMFHLGLDACQSEILGHLGYPRNWSAWEGNWMTQNQARQIPFVTLTATAQLFADVGPAHVAEVRAQACRNEIAKGEGPGYTPDPENWQRRTLAIVDVDDTAFYCVDLYRIAGGREHWWTFHAQEGEFTTTGLQLQKQNGGTLAGPDVPYGDPQWLAANGCRKGTYGYRGAMFAFPHLDTVERASPPGVWSADWALKDADGLHFRLTVPQTDAAEVVLCNGKSPAGGSPYEMKWVLMHNRGEEPQKTQIAALMELYRGEPIIKSVQPLPLSGADEHGFRACGMVVDLGHRQDTLFIAADATVTRTAPGGFEFAGRFGLYSERNGDPVNLVLVGGTRLTRNGSGILQNAAEYRARITAVTRAEERVTLSPAAENPAALEGNTVYITNEFRRLAYKVLTAANTPAGTVLRLEFDSRVGTGRVTGVTGHRLETDTPFKLAGFRYYHGARLVNAAKTAEYRIAGVHSAKFVLIDNAAHPEPDPVRLAAEFPPGTWFDIYDYGVGDEIVWPHTTCVTRTGPTTSSVSATGTVRLTLPEER